MATNRNSLLKYGDMQIFSSKKSLVQFALGLFINIVQKFTQKHRSQLYNLIYFFFEIKVSFDLLFLKK
jgi:hypothetical protein